MTAFARHADMLIESRRDCVHDVSHSFAQNKRQAFGRVVLIVCLFAASLLELSKIPQRE